MAKNGKKSKKKLIIIIAAVVIIGGIVIANVLKKPEKGIEVQTAEVERGTIIQTVSASGKIKPVVEVKMSAKVSGNITMLNVEEGDSVHKDDLLLRLDRERLIAMKERAESGLKSSEASLWKAQADYDRMKELFGKRLASEAELQSAEASLRLAESQVEMSKASLKECNDDLSKTEIFSPMDGVVSQMNKELGEMVLGASFQEDVIMVIADLSNMEVEVEVDENDVVDVTVDDPVDIEIDAFPDTTFRGIVTRIANSAVTRGFGTQDEITNFKVEIAVVDEIKGIRPGMSATVDIEVEKHEDAIYIPIQCVAMRMPKSEEDADAEGEADSEKAADAGGHEHESAADKESKDEEMIEVVFVVDESDSARMLPVVTGITSDTDIEILDGLEEDQKVVSGPYRVLATSIQDGEAVREEEDKKSGDNQEDDR